MRKHVDFLNERNGLNDSDLLIEAFSFELFKWYKIENEKQVHCIAQCISYTPFAFG